jgi:hypothetical protein
MDEEPVERGLRPHAEIMARRLQAAGYNHGYEDAHPSNATTRQTKADAVSRQTLADLLIAIAALGSEAQHLRAERVRLHDALRSIDFAAGHSIGGTATEMEDDLIDIGREARAVLGPNVGAERQ